MKYTKLLYGFIVCLLLLVLTGCKGCYKNRMAAMADPIREITSVDIPVSTINIPVFYEVKNFEEWINKKITGRFLETTVYPSSNKKDEVKLEFTKIDPIRITTSGNRLLCNLPLHITGEIVNSRLGKLITDRFKTVEAQVVIQLATTVGIDAGWNILTKFKVQKVAWIKEPVLQFGPVKYNLEKKVSKWLNENEQQLIHMLDKEINESVSLEPVISKIWTDLQKPLVVHRKQPMAWMKFTCNSIEGKVELQPGIIACYTSVRAKMMMMTDTTNLAAPSRLPMFKSLRNVSPTSELYLYAFASFDEINEEINKLLKGKSFTAKGYNVSVKDVRAYASEAGLSVEINTGKDIAGKMIASGKPEFEVATQTIRINNFEYAIASDNSLVNAGEELLHQNIRDTIASKLSLKLDSFIHIVPPLVEEAIAKGKAGKSVAINFDHLYVKDCRIIMAKDQVHFKIHAGAIADIKLMEMKPGKKLRIKKNTSVK
ncbi:DUF4403 family protein [Lacibacter luteus]|nr:DUF4403 family protein [Lacibacter luteus]